MEIPVPDYTGRILGNWRLVRQLGQGSFGMVYEAENCTIRKQAAVKVLHPHMAVDEDIKRRFINEASAAGQIDHDNIVQVFDGNVDQDGLCYLVMELLRGGVTLQQLIAAGPIPLPRLCDLGAQIASALQAAHDHGIVHRDLKPENLMVVSRSHHPAFVKVLDFGVAKLRSVGPGTVPGTAMGTPHFMSPEQWRTLPDLDGRADIYTLGIILYECLTGQLPYQAQSLEQWCCAHLLGPVPDPSVLVPLTPPWLGQLIQRMMAKEREARPQTMAEVRDVLLRQAPSPSPAPATPGPPAPPPTMDEASDTVVGIPEGAIPPSTLSPSSGQSILRLRSRRAALLFGVGGLLMAGALLAGSAALRPHLPKPSATPGTPESPPRPPSEEAGPPGIPDEMAVLGPDRFRMGRGAAPGAKGREAAPDGPAHEVSVSRFAIGKFEVSMAAYREFARKARLAGALPWEGNPDFDKIAALPVNQITQAQAAAYCRWRYPTQGGRLPTEVEWEFAARDGAAGRRYPFGDRLDAKRVNAGRQPARFVPVTGLSAGATSAGVQHLLGNVAEWTDGPAARYPGGPPVPRSTAVVRGGDLMTPPKDLSITARGFFLPSAAGPLVGFRCAFSVP